MPLVVNEQGIEPIKIKKSIQFVSFKFADIQLPDKLNFFGGATSFDSSLKAYKASETRIYFS